MRHSAIAVLVVIPLVLALSACRPDSPTPVTANTGPAVPSTPVAPPGPGVPPTIPLDADVVMLVTAVATADNGSVMDISLAIHRSTAWSDPAGADRADTMTLACSGGLDAGVYEANLWSFAAADLTAIQRPGPVWPSNRRLFVEPLAGYVTVATDGFPLDDDEATAETLHCLRDKYFEGPGSGTVVVGFAGDTDEVEAAGHFTKWANHQWGFSGVRLGDQTAASSGISLSDCTHTVTPAGLELNGDATWWHSIETDTHCIFGSAQETKDF